MDNLYSGRINKRILSGHLPHYKLERPTYEILEEIDLSEYAARGLSMIDDAVVPLYMALQANASAFEGIGCFPPSSIHLLINTGFNPQLVDIEKPYMRKALQLKPFVTTLDKALWCTIINYTSMADISESHAFTDVLYAWVHLFTLVQQKEAQHGITINIQAITAETPVLELLCNSWDNCDKSWFLELTAEEICAFNTLSQERRAVKAEIQKEISDAKRIAEETEAEWQQFLDIVNDLARWERHVVSQICAPISEVTKLNSLNLYTDIILRVIESDHYFINHNLVPLQPLLDAVERRMKYASAFCVILDPFDQPVRLREEIVQLLRHPQTFNYLFIVYHQFRLDPQPKNAIRFSQTALSYLKKNLCFDAEGVSQSIDDIAKEFYTCVAMFKDEGQHKISKLTFSKLQQDSIILGESSLYAAWNDAINDQLTNAYSTLFDSIDTSDPASIIKDFQDASRFSELLGMKNNDVMSYFEDTAEDTLARQIVVSLNIIYLFCDALRLMLENNDEYGYIENASDVNEYRNKLRKVSNWVACTVYEDDVDLDQYREDVGIDARSISDQEAKEEQLRSSTFLSIFKECMAAVTKQVKGRNIDGLLSVNSTFRAEILQCPTSKLKEQYAEELLDLSDQICHSLVDICKTEDNNFDRTRQDILMKLGSEACLLPMSALDSLTTAELLFSQYASEAYAQKGFDYSCISALYYQAFEEAYNKLIWLGYAELINTQQVGDRNLGDILFEFQNEKIPILEARGYFSQNARTRRCYLDYNENSSPKATAKPHCMYKSFAILMYQVKRGSDLKRFCDYFAELTGFDSREEMYSDSVFMETVREFAKTVDESAQNRNNASHGGTLITVGQCQQDKLTILNELETVRIDSIGLIQKLLYLMRKSNTTE